MEGLVKKRVDQIKRWRYGLKIDGKTVYAEPTRELIADAIEKNQLERRGLQEYAALLFEEWERVPAVDRARVVQQYHSSRVAFFCVNGWDDPISLCVHDMLEDGAHRLLAAKHKTIDTVDCVIVECRKCGNGPTK